MRKVIDGLIQAIKNDEKITQLAKELGNVAKQMRESYQVTEKEIHEIDKRLVRLETMVEMAQKNQVPQPKIESK